MDRRRGGQTAHSAQLAFKDQKSSRRMTTSCWLIGDRAPDGGEKVVITAGCRGPGRWVSGERRARAGKDAGISKNLSSTKKRKRSRSPLHVALGVAVNG